MNPLPTPPRGVTMPPPPHPTGPPPRGLPPPAASPQPPRTSVPSGAGTSGTRVGTMQPRAMLPSGTASGVVLGATSGVMPDATGGFMPSGPSGAGTSGTRVGTMQPRAMLPSGTTSGVVLDATSGFMPSGTVSGTMPSGPMPSGAGTGGTMQPRAVPSGMGSGVTPNATSGFMPGAMIPSGFTPSGPSGAGTSGMRVGTTQPRAMLPSGTASGAMPGATPSAVIPSGAGMMPSGAGTSGTPVGTTQPRAMLSGTMSGVVPGATSGFMPGAILPSGVMPSARIPSGTFVGTTQPRAMPSGTVSGGAMSNATSGFIANAMNGALPSATSGFMPRATIPSGTLVGTTQPRAMPSGTGSGAMPNATSGFMPGAMIPSGFMPSGPMPSGAGTSGTPVGTMQARAMPSGMVSGAMPNATSGFMPGATGGATMSAMIPSGAGIIPSGAGMNGVPIGTMQQRAMPSTTSAMITNGAVMNGVPIGTMQQRAMPSGTVPSGIMQPRTSAMMPSGSMPAEMPSGNTPGMSGNAMTTQQRAMPSGTMPMGMPSTAIPNAPRGTTSSGTTIPSINGGGMPPQAGRGVAIPPQPYGGVILPMGGERMPPQHGGAMHMNAPRTPYVGMPAQAGAQQPMQYGAPVQQTGMLPQTSARGPLSMPLQANAPSAMIASGYHLGGMPPPISQLQGMPMQVGGGGMPMQVGGGGMPPTSVAQPQGMISLPPHPRGMPLGGGPRGMPPPHSPRSALHHAAPPALSQALPQKPSSSSATIRPNLEQCYPPFIASGYATDRFGTTTPAPAASWPFVTFDNGYTTARYLRPTTRLIPATSSLADQLKIPLAVCCTPFADPVMGESPVPLSEWTHETGPVRCARCRGYLNCFIRANSDFSKWECSLCGHENETPTHYRGFAQGANVAELRFGSVDFDVPKVFFAAEKLGPKPDYCILLDATQASIKSGLFSFTMYALVKLVREQCFAGAENARVGIITYDETGVHFYEQTSRPDRPRVVVSADVEDGFAPLPQSALLLPQTEPAKLEAFLQFVAGRFLAESASLPPQSMNAPAENIGGFALKSAFYVMKELGGRVIWFTSGLPNQGQGKLVDRDLTGLVGTDQEQVLYASPKDERFFNELSLQCVAADVTVDVMAFGAAYVDAATLVQVSSTTGGNFERISMFQAAHATHRFALERHLRAVASGARAFGAIMRVRTSNGLKVNRFQSHGFPEDGNLRASCCTNEFSILVDFTHDGTKLDDTKGRAVIQFAALHTTPEGKRRLRVHNIALQAKEDATLLIHALDVTAVASVSARWASLQLAESPVSKCRDQIVRDLVASYRQVVTRRGVNMPSAGVPVDPIELILLYTSSLLKSPALLLNRPLDRGVKDPFARADARVLSRFKFLMSSPERLVLALYPAVYDLSNPLTYGDVLPQVADQSISNLPPMSHQKHIYRLPLRVPCSSEFLRAEGVFLVHDGSGDLDLFIGAHAPPDLVASLVAGNAAANTTSRSVVLSNDGKNGNNSAQSKLFAIASQLIENCPGIPPHGGLSEIPVTLAHGGSQDFFNENKAFLSKFVEDKLYAEPSYQSFVVHIFQMLEMSKG